MEGGVGGVGCLLLTPCGPPEPMHLDKPPSTVYTLSTPGWFRTSSTVSPGDLLKCRFFKSHPRPIDSVYSLTKFPGDLQLPIYFAFITVERLFPEGGTTNFAFPRSLSTPSPWWLPHCLYGKPFLKKTSAPKCTRSSLTSVKYC